MKKKLAVGIVAALIATAAPVSPAQAAGVYVEQMDSRWVVRNFIGVIAVFYTFHQAMGAIPDIARQLAGPAY